MPECLCHPAWCPVRWGEPVISQSTIVQKPTWPPANKRPGMVQVGWYLAESSPPITHGGVRVNVWGPAYKPEAAA